MKTKISRFAPFNRMYEELKNSVFFKRFYVSSVSSVFNKKTYPEEKDVVKKKTIFSSAISNPCAGWQVGKAAGWLVGRLAGWQVSTKNDSLISQWEREKREQKEREERTWCPQIALRIHLFGKEERG